MKSFFVLGAATALLTVIASRVVPQTVLRLRRPGYAGTVAILVDEST